MFAALALSGCSPVPMPPWFVDIPSTVAISQEIVRQGPYGERQPPTSPRSAHEALPRDTIRLTPFVIERSGPVPPERVDLAAFLCSVPDCVLGLSNDAPPACPPAPTYNATTACRLGRGPTIEFELGEPELGGELNLVQLLAAPSVVFVGSATPSVPATTCLDRLAAGAAMQECFTLSRRVHMGPASVLVEAAEDAGIDLPVGSGQGVLLGWERNHNPRVDTFEIAVEGQVTRVPHGSTVEVRSDGLLRIRYLPDDLDVEHQTLLDPYDPDTEPSIVTELLRGRWYASNREIELDAGIDGGLAADVVVPPHTPAFHLYFVVADDRGSEAWGWLVIAPTD